MSAFQKSIERMNGIVGLDRAVFFTVSARLLQIVSSTGTVLLIIRFLSPVEQGYYYTLLSLAALQTIFELGFSFVILQLAAHESALLKIHPNGQIEGDSVAHARLASVLQLTIRWYLRAAVVLATLLLPVGFLFFSQRGHASDHVQWHGPWMATVFTISGSFLLTPLFSFLEGCQHVQQVARLRMCQAFIVLAMSWGAIASGHGLYACALVNVGWITAGLVFLANRRHFMLSLLRHPVRDHAVSWLDEIWPFQWKIAVSWLCSYFTIQVFTPILFAFRGPQEAGRMGLSLSIVGYLPIVALCWITPKAAQFGRLVKFGKFDELDSLFFKALRRSMVLILLLSTGTIVAVICARYVLPKIAARMETPVIFLFLLFTATSSFVIQGMAIYLRSFKREPYLLQSIVVAGCTVASALYAAPRWGGAAVAITYFSFSGVLGLIWAIATFLRTKENNAPRLNGTPLPDDTTYSLNESEAQCPRKQEAVTGGAG